MNRDRGLLAGVRVGVGVDVDVAVALVVAVAVGTAVLCTPVAVLDEPHPASERPRITTTTTSGEVTSMRECGLMAVNIADEYSVGQSIADNVSHSRGDAR
jgi:hypothetical protein